MKIKEIPASLSDVIMCDVTSYDVMTTFFIPSINFLHLAPVTARIVKISFDPGLQNIP